MNTPLGVLIIPSKRAIFEVLEKQLQTTFSETKVLLAHAFRYYGFAML
jgi:hypothetical protein